MKKRGLAVQPFKKGPDYIDPLWLTRAAAKACFNLDFFTMNQAEIQTCFNTHASVSDISLIEGNKGLFDGVWMLPAATAMLRSRNYYQHRSYWLSIPAA